MKCSVPQNMVEVIDGEQSKCFGWVLLSDERYFELQGLDTLPGCVILLKV